MTFHSKVKKKLARLLVNTLMFKADRVAKTLGISRATVYRYIKK
ncbi:MAG: hypothetical protein CBD97_01700 [Pelagibacteraceae bacterium TMED237]|nr:MAG: hypothetical protein CBD97_01700 [Pelagibacteraceae bacterium TMED237]